MPLTDLIDRAHDHGPLIHTWTFRTEQSRLANQYMGNPINEYLQFNELGIDGVFRTSRPRRHGARAVLGGLVPGGLRGMLDHMGFDVSDYERSRAFYEKRSRRSA